MLKEEEEEEEEVFSSSPSFALLTVKLPVSVFGFGEVFCPTFRAGCRAAVFLDAKDAKIGVGSRCW